MLYTIILTIGLTLFAAAVAWILSEIVRACRKEDRIIEAYQKGREDGWNARNSFNDSVRSMEIDNARSNGIREGARMATACLKSDIKERAEAIESLSDRGLLKKLGIDSKSKSDYHAKTESWDCSTDVTALGWKLDAFPTTMFFQGVTLCRIDRYSEFALYENLGRNCRLKVWNK